jgi:glutamyl-tRNA reductase
LTFNTKTFNSQLSNTLFSIGVSHKSSSIDIREKFSFSSYELNKALDYLSKQIGPLVILSTCNRTELYFSSEQNSREALKALSEFKKLDLSFISEHSYSFDSINCVRHLFKVAAGLESMILGEGQILNQVKTAYTQSQNHTNGTLNQLFQRSLAAGKKVRSKTEISRGAMSVPAASLQVIQESLNPKELSEQKIMILGSGEVSQLCLEHLHSQGASEHITLVSRSPETHSLQLTKYQSVQNISYASLQTHICEQDVILVCTSAPHFVIDMAELEAIKKPMIICDMCLPRNVNPAVANLPLIKLIDLDYLQKTVSANASKRSGQINQAEEIIEEEIEKFLDWMQKTQTFQKQKNQENAQSILTRI